MRFIAATMLLAFILISQAAYSHQAASGWQYPMECCSDRDCHLIDAQFVHETQEGWDIAPSEGGGFVKRGTERQSPDGEFHLCRSEYSKNILCFFVPPMGS